MCTARSWNQRTRVNAVLPFVCGEARARTRLLTCITVALLSAVFLPSTAFGALDGSTITSPSGSNHCRWYTVIPSVATDEAGVVCTSTAGPKAGFAVLLTASGGRWRGYAARRWLFHAGPRLAYGSSQSRFGITCTSLTSGLRCVQRSSGHVIFVNTKQHGYSDAAGPDDIVPTGGQAPPASRNAPPQSSTQPKSPPVYIPYPGNGGGPTLCSDGSTSHSSGSGTCSHHGGIA